MASAGDSKQRVAVPKYHRGIGIAAIVICLALLFLLNARASSFDTIASALGLYSAALLGVFTILTSWRSAVTNRKQRYMQVEDKWRSVIDRSVLFALRGSTLSFMLMLFSVIAPAIKGQFADLVGTDVYDFLARSISAIAISGVVLLGLMSLQIVRDVTAVYEWNNGIEEQDAITQAQRDAQKKI
ncbi:hypothetical protein [Frigoribacterium faeni]|uniref:Uncharacterized protein n=1 Tax=Frigoribacterium faeni TaxID=145483 RepID=A0A7W3PI84_9MICO|nr:hypothetical protein [Frigoribacterium faeni]MBA8813150.1 hypothetical protein [Frigoribacterium faeni]GEK83454.1 hypothetical protein FFA01_17630 [Frigoribacterium faeni]